MPRVSSRKTRQAVLVTGDPVDTDELPDSLELFNELGEPLMLGGTVARLTLTDSTAVIPVGGVETHSVDIAPSARIFSLSTNRPARVRMYPTAAQRNADLARVIGQKPQGNHGRLLEVVTATGLLALTLSPVVDITSAVPFDGHFYVSVTNLDTAAGAVAVTYNYFRTE